MSTWIYCLWGPFMSQHMYFSRKSQTPCRSATPRHPGLGEHWAFPCRYDTNIGALYSNARRPPVRPPASPLLLLSFKSQRVWVQNKSINTCTKGMYKSFKEKSINYTSTCSISHPSINQRFLNIWKSCISQQPIHFVNSEIPTILCVFKLPVNITIETRTRVFKLCVVFESTSSCFNLLGKYPTCHTYTATHTQAMLMFQNHRTSHHVSRKQDIRCRKPGCPKGRKLLSMRLWVGLVKIIEHCMLEKNMIF